MTSANAGPALSWRQRPAAQRILCPLRTNGRRLVAGVRTPLPLRDAMVGLRRRAGGSPCRVMGGRHQRRRDARRDTNAGAPRPRPVLVRLLPGEGARRPGGHYCDVKCEAELCLAPDRACGSSSGSSRCLDVQQPGCGDRPERVGVEARRRRCASLWCSFAGGIGCEAGWDGRRLGGFARVAGAYGDDRGGTKMLATSSAR